MSWFKSKSLPQPDAPKTRVELVEYIDNETAKKHWDVMIHRYLPVSGWSRHSITDDYGFKDRDEALAAYTRRLAIERGEIKVGLSRYTIEETEI